ncbi:unnamed protein product [Allacma fusca]|uniref:Uncharacterized protein n=1 Tax=Allacma fusca TaxID=39272 RepID=A0A8J2NRU3_9HEXA|nr:unnamed protein product [Allacma fusca]
MAKFFKSLAPDYMKHKVVKKSEEGLNLNEIILPFTKLARISGTFPVVIQKPSRSLNKSSDSTSGGPDLLFKWSSPILCYSIIWSIIKGLYWIMFLLNTGLKLPWPDSIFDENASALVTSSHLGQEFGEVVRSLFVFIYPLQNIISQFILAWDFPRRMEFFNTIPQIERKMGKAFPGEIKNQIRKSNFKFIFWALLLFIPGFLLGVCLPTLCNNVRVGTFLVPNYMIVVLGFIFMGTLFSRVVEDVNMFLMLFMVKELFRQSQLYLSGREMMESIDFCHSKFE